MRSRGGVRSFPAPRPPHFGEWMWCKWCGERIPDVIDGKRSTQRYWHPACAHEYNLHTRLPEQYDFLVERDGERCALCPEGTPRPMRWRASETIVITRQSCFGHRPGVPGWWDVFPERPAGRYSEWTEEERMTGAHVEVERVCALEVDHRVPLWSVADLPDEERRWYFGPGNLWLLCPTHHRAKTAAEAARRARERASGRASDRHPPPDLFSLPD